MKKKMIIGASILFLIVCTIFLYRLGVQDTSLLQISEVVTANGSLADEDGEYPDWIELYYSGKQPLDLSGYYLSDDHEEIRRWTFPQVVMEPDSYLVIFASGKDLITENGEIHTNFKLDAMGESLYLSDREGKSAAVLEVPEISFDCSYGLMPEKEAYAVFETGSPWQPNWQELSVEVKKTAAVSYSMAPGSYSEEIYLELTAEEEDAQIYYTLDGSIPDENSLQYDGEAMLIADRTWEENRYTSIWMSAADWEVPGAFTYNPNPQYKATVVKTRLYFPKENVWSEDVWTNTYLIGEDYTLPVVSLSVQDADLFDEDTGIYVPGDAYENYLATAEEINPEPRKRIGNYSSDRKVAGYLEYFTEDGSRVMENQVTMRICGNISRGSGMKSLKLYAWGDEKTGRFDYPVFGEQCVDLEGSQIISFATLRLRNFGNDWRRSKIRDILGQRLVQDLGFGTQGYQPCILLINGEYFGICEIRENRDDEYFENYFGISEGNLKRVRIAELSDEKKTDAETEFLNLVEYVKTHDLSKAEHYSYVEEQLDVEQFLDFVQIQLYLQNLDWLYGNTDFFRCIEKREGSECEDGRWRVSLYDLDYSVNYEYEDNYKTFLESDAVSAVLFRGLMQNPEWKQWFVDRFEELLETHFDPETAIELQLQLEEQLAPEIEEDFSRWNVYYTKSYRAEQAEAGNQLGEIAKGIDSAYWYEKMEDLRRFFRDRPSYARQYFYENIY